MKHVGVVMVGVLVLSGCSPLPAPGPSVDRHPSAGASAAPVGGATSVSAVTSAAAPPPVAPSDSASSAQRGSSTASTATTGSAPDWEELKRKAGPMPEAFRRAVDGSGVSLDGAVEIKPDQAPEPAREPSSREAEQGEPPAQTPTSEGRQDEHARDEPVADAPDEKETPAEKTQDPEEVSVPGTSASYADAVAAAWGAGDWQRLSGLADDESLARLQQAGPGGDGWTRGEEISGEGEGIIFRFESDSDERVVEVTLHRRAAALHMPRAASVRFV